MAAKATVRRGKKYKVAKRDEAGKMVWLPRRKGQDR